MTIKKLCILTLDTETIGLEGHVYDIAYAIHDKKGNIQETKNYLIREIMTDGQKMTGAYYSKKTFTDYIPMLDSGDIKLINWQKMQKIFLNDLIDYNVDILAAYNLAFDSRALRETNTLLTGGKKFLENKIDLLDIWRFACLTILNQKAYKWLADANGWRSDAGNYRTTAEHAFRYISNQNDYIENHTALDDVIIEVGILAECYRQKKKVPYNDLSGSPWRLCQ